MQNFAHDNILYFYDKVYKLKKLVRKGWTFHNILNPESVAEHSFGVIALALVYCKQKNDFDINKVIKIAIIHDLGEAIIGDITPHDNISLKQKRILEININKKIFKQVDDSGEFVELWIDCQDGRTKEGKLVKELDKLEMALQAYHYEKDNKINKEEFFNSTAQALESEELIEVLKKILELRAIC